MDFSNLKIFKDKIKLAEAFWEELAQSISRRDRFYLALSGGSTPKIIFQVLAKGYKSKINWNEVHIFWGDERCVPPEDNYSNYGMTKKYLLDYIKIPENNVHRIRGENNPESEAERYSEEIKTFVPIKNGLPVFDLIMLGVGEDGHTASIFSNQMQLLQSDKICDMAIHPSSGQKRITLTGKVINNSEQIIFLVTGREKAPILKNILVGGGKIFPAQFIIPVKGNLNYFVDSEAAQLLSKM